MKLMHPVTGFVRDVNDERRIQILRRRGFVDVPDDTPLGGNRPPRGADGPVQRDDTSSEVTKVAVTPVTPQPTTPDVDPPAHSAPKADWVAYAESQGLGGADGMTKAELIEALGG